ncbi:GDSL-type esterase/lipase family protein [uncultured Shewanella sp.]|uniref:GDSL-type esterase/lipase family protein n=1 Tax=uncultured Shewanella sp. TaxID=173975 RepID=UPI002630D591|nr:GDSL-type esterase/lipase family protein [uncultured Shewanella sp.]
MLPSNSTIIPQDKLNSQRWAKRHFDILSRHQQNHVSPDVILMGDSIMQQWEQAGGKVLQHWTEKLTIHNLGFSGDKIQHALWRVQNGQLDNINPALLLLNIGTNNIFDHTAEEIALGVKQLVHQIQYKQPKVKILLHRLFPRGEKGSDERQKVTQASSLYSNLNTNKLINYIDINDIFLSYQGNIPRDIMHDKLHLTPKAYALWLQHLQPYFEQCLKKQLLC